MPLLCIAKMEVSVVGMDPSALTMTSRDVIISYRDSSANTTYHLQVDRTDNTTVLATEVLDIYMCAVEQFLFGFILAGHGKRNHFPNVYKSTNDDE